VAELRIDLNKILPISFKEGIYNEGKSFRKTYL